MLSSDGSLIVCPCLSVFDSDSDSAALSLRLRQRLQSAASAPRAAGLSSLKVPLGHNIVHSMYLTGNPECRMQRADLIQIGTCQRHTMCSWPQQPDPPQSDTCQAHTMRSRSPWSDLSQARVISYEAFWCTDDPMPEQQSRL